MLKVFGARCSADLVLRDAARALHVGRVCLVLPRLLARLLDVVLQVEDLPEVVVRLQLLLRGGGQLAPSESKIGGIHGALAQPHISASKLLRKVV